VCGLAPSGMLQRAALAKAASMARMDRPRRFGAAAAPAGRSGDTVAERDSKRIIRQWDREIEDEIRRKTARDNTDGPWKAVAWAGLWMAWLALLVALVAHVKSLG
jgi:hypothetical protein